MHRRARIMITGLLTFVAASVSLVQAEDDTSYKADFIIKLFDYVQWPAGSGADSNGSATIGVVGDGPMVAALKASAEKNAAGKKINIKALALTDPLAECAILFLPMTDKTELAKVLKKLGASPVVTVSDCAGFAGFGVMVNFFKEAETGKVKFEINNLAAGDAKLKISSQLLKLAKII